MNISEILKLKTKGSNNFDFVDAKLDDDVPLFADPILIEKSKSNLGKESHSIISSFSGAFYNAYKNDDRDKKITILSHAHEPNATKLGYGNGKNGKGNTAEGLKDAFQPLEELIHKIPTISKPADLCIFLPGFAEDGLSDLLTNVLHDKLNEFTMQQLDKYDIISNGTATFWSWDKEESNWKLITRPAFLFEGKELLLVPKEFVRKHYLFSADQYFSRIILEHYQEENYFNGKKIPKKEIIRYYKSKEDHGIYKEVVNKTISNYQFLSEYHSKLTNDFYSGIGPISDDELDKIVY